MSPAASSAVATLIRRRGGGCKSMFLFDPLVGRRFSTKTLPQLDIKQTQPQIQIQASRSGNLDAPRSFSSQALTRGTNKVPCLLVPSRKNPKSCCSLFTLNTSTENFLKYEREIKLPKVCSTTETSWVGSSEGIIFTVPTAISKLSAPRTRKKSYKMFAFDPLTRTHLPLPSPDTLVPHQGTFPTVPYLGKVILSPSRDVLALNRVGQADFAVRSDGRWGCWRSLGRAPDYIDDIIFHKGLLYALHTDGLLSIYDFSASSSSSSSSGLPPATLSGNDCLHWEDDHVFDRCLVESPDGNDLYLIYLDNPPYFKVFKLNSEGKWTRVSTIGDMAIFRGINHSLSFSATDFPGSLKPNSIYFTERNLNGHPESTGVFSLEEESTYFFKLTYDGQDVLDWPSWAETIWLMPATTS